MAFCGKCGAKVSDNLKFCSQCGAALEGADPEIKKGGTVDVTEKISKLNNTRDTTADFDNSDVQDNKVMAILAYLSWLVLIPLLAAPKSKFARFHANQGLVLAIAEIAWWIVQAIVYAILVAISWRLLFISTILGITNILFLVLAILGIVNASTGKAKELPIIGKFKILK